ncbi:hypothetical protein EDB81DRAFT_650436 [Dactylonectria macrodidyma]|uniref:AMP-activated protein kinase glycogen-binding domain-containing protein n=1 Tax=Dactylonectria macrodidyma TaxID=307937 RepID=A0A9P9EZF4_9HYPO|nr:hypothetical protein EDB81DRAFT_650436 [Dactylonectria macrodidyma]
MGSFTFKWYHPAEEVYVTGTFDGWTKSVRLQKDGDIFQKSVELEDASEKIYYKFVVDNNWVLNESAPKEPDLEGNVNNFLTPEQITTAAPTAAVINSVTPASSTAAMAAEQPFENKALEAETKAIDEKAVETSIAPPAENKPVEEEVINEKSAEAPVETEKPPTPTDIPGGFPATPATELDKPIGINPLPASEGGVNPINLQPGEKIPETIAAQSTDKYVKLDKESYEKSDALPGIETELPPVSSNTIPESSLPVADVNDVTISSVAPTSTTAALAGEVPLETKAPEVPEIVKESQEKANVTPEASAEPEEVKEKAEVEAELKEKVPAAAVTSDGSDKKEIEPDSDIAAIAATAGGAAIAAYLVATETVESKTPVVDETPSVAKDIPEPVKESAPVEEAVVSETKPEVSTAVPVEVKESIIEAKESPEAAANTEAVEDKKAVEAELLQEVKPVATEAEVKPEVSPVVPVEVKESIIEAEKSPEAAANTEAVEDKKTVEAELLKEVKPVPAEAETKPEAPKTEEAKPEEVKTEEVKTEAVKTETPVASTETPVVSTENGTKATENGSKAAENGSKAEESSANGSTSKVETKKKKRLSSMFQKLKQKFA